MWVLCPSAVTGLLGGGVHSAVSDAGKVWDFPRLYNEGDHLKGLSLVLQHEEDENNSHTGK